MAEFPALPLFTDAYLGDTTHLTTIEHGAYLLLLMVAWRSKDCALPDDDRLLARYAKCTAGQWARIRPILEPFFTVSSDGWRQGRLTDEAALVRQRRQSQADNGRLSALKRKGRHLTKREPSESEASTPKPNPTPTVLKDKPSTTRASTLPKNFEPAPTGKTLEIVNGWAPGRLEREIDKFRNHHTAKGTTMKDWQAAFRTWVGNADDWSRNDHRTDDAEFRNPMVAAAAAFIRDERASGQRDFLSPDGDEVRPFDA